MRAIAQILIVAAAVGGAITLARDIGFADGGLIGVAWHSGIALAAAVRLRERGAVGVFIGHTGAELLWDQALQASLVCGAAHALAAIAAQRVMVRFARQRQIRTNTSDWLIFFSGACAFAVTATAVETLGRIASGGALAELISFVPLRAMLEMLGVTSVGAVFAKLGEVRHLRRPDVGTIGAALLTIALVTIVGALLSDPSAASGRSTIIVLLAIPISIWLSLMPHSLAGAIISLLGFHSALWLLAQNVGGPTDPEYGMVAASYLVLVVSFQLVHALNLDRIAAARLIAAHNDELERRVAHRTARLEAMTKRAVAADRAKSEFLARISHELRTPLNGVLGISGVMLAGELSETDRRNVAMIRDSGLGLLELIEQVLVFTTATGPDDDLQKAGDRLKARPFALRETLEIAAEEARARALDAVELRVDLDDRAPSLISGDEGQIRLVLAKLLDNALKFTPKGVVTLAAFPTSRSDTRVIRFEVADTGIGVAPEHLERIFKPFEQADGTDRRVYGGAGLGLSIASEVVRQMGGTLSVESDPGEGSTFWFELECAANENGSEAAA